MQVALESGSAGQGAFRFGGNTLQDLEQRVVATVVGVVAVGVASEDLVDLQHQQGFQRVRDILGGARVGQSSGQVGQDTEGYVEFANGE